MEKTEIISLIELLYLHIVWEQVWQGSEKLFPFDIDKGTSTLLVLFITELALQPTHLQFSSYVHIIEKV